MKPCPNCRTIHQDNYNGQCQDCGAPLSGVASNGSGDMSFRLAKQLQQGARESNQEQQMKRGNYSGVSLEQSIIDVASQFVVVDQEKLRQLEEKANA